MQYCYICSLSCIAAAGLLLRRNLLASCCDAICWPPDLKNFKEMAKRDAAEIGAEDAIIYPRIGSSGLWTIPPKKLKIGIVNVNERSIEEQLDSVFAVPLHSVAISGRGNSLKDVFLSDSSFSTVNEKLATSILPSSVPLSTMFKKLNAEDKKKLCKDLNMYVAHSIISMCGVASSSVDSGESTENHKEFTDKQALRTIMTTLYNPKAKNSTIAYMDEIRLNLPEGTAGVSGAYDLLLCSYIQNQEGINQEDILPELVVKINDGENKPILGETGVNLVGRDVQRSAQRELDESSEAINDIQSVSQPVAEILIFSQIPTIIEPVILFYANRQVLRPFIYYKNGDILLTTKEAYQWHTCGQLNIHGVILMAVLMRSSEYLTCRENYGMKVSSLKKKVVEKTGFFDAVGANNIYREAILKPETFREKKIHKSAVPSSTMSETHQEISDEIDAMSD